MTVYPASGKEMWLFAIKNTIYGDDLGREKIHRH